MPGPNQDFTVVIPLYNRESLIVETLEFDTPADLARHRGDRGR